MEQHENWPARFEHAIRVVRQPTFLLNELDDPPPETTLKALAAVYRRVVGAGNTLHAGLEGISELYADTVKDALVRLARAITTRLRGSDKESGLLDPNDFEIGYLPRPDGVTGPPMYATGTINSLPANHWLREHDLGEFLQDGSAGPVIVFGAAATGAGGQYVPRFFYCIETAWSATRYLRSRQLEAERTEREREERARREAEQRARLHPELQAQQLDELKAKNQQLEEKLAALSPQ